MLDSPPHLRRTEGIHTSHRHLLGLVLESDGPAWRLGREPESLPLRKGIDFDYCAVGLITKIVTDLVELPDCGNDFFGGRGAPNPFTVRQSEFLQHREKVGMSFQFHSDKGPGSVENDSERAARDQSGIELFQ